MDGDYVYWTIIQLVIYRTVFWLVCLSYCSYVYVYLSIMPYAASHFGGKIPKWLCVLGLAFFLHQTFRHDYWALISPFWCKLSLAYNITVQHSVAWHCNWNHVLLYSSKVNSFNTFIYTHFTRCVSFLFSRFCVRFYLKSQGRCTGYYFSWTDVYVAFYLPSLQMNKINCSVLFLIELVSLILHLSGHGRPILRY